MSKFNSNSSMVREHTFKVHQYMSRTIILSDPKTKDQRHYEFLSEVLSCLCSIGEKDSCLHSISPFSQLGTQVLIYYYMPVNNKLLTQPLSLKHGRINGYVTKNVVMDKYEMYIDLSKDSKQDYLFYTIDKSSIFKRSIEVYTDSGKIADISVNPQKTMYILTFNEREQLVVLLEKVSFYNITVLIPNTLFHTGSNNSIIKAWKNDKKLSQSGKKRCIDVYTEAMYPYRETMDNEENEWIINIVDKNFKSVFSTNVVNNKSHLDFENPFSPLVSFVISITTLDDYKI